MKPVILALACGGALLARAAIAHACGGDGGDSGSSSSSSSDSGSYDSSDSSGTYVPPCVDATDVHGYRACSDYGAGWGQMAALPAVSFELQTWAAQIDLRDVDVSGGISHTTGPDYQYRVVGEDLGNEAMAVGLKGRIMVHGKGAFYGGVESGFAALSTGDGAAARSMADNTAMLTPRAATAFFVGAVLGAETRMGRLTLAGEVLGGFRGVNVTAESHRGACETTETSIDPNALVEGRVRADVWVTPWVTLGAYAGRDVATESTSVGVGIGGHVRAFDGTR